MDMTRSAESAGRALDGVRFKILGPIEVTSGDAPVRIPPGRQPIILGALLLEPNRVVSIDRLIDVVWDEKPPATARTTRSASSRSRTCRGNLRLWRGGT